ncbi:Methyltransferases isoform 1 [Tripterygium wilfordii]|uniref:tRNA:m(4)X modification enzyme TRM13 n=1 Tax=Tripterygium wilfordii TaxID=458696 RepID=A0A7J7CEB3_TRIWF|nr:tRNA:m(4)X modification enzyme TRM13 homolog [Tripterygium wilfordii]KAF5732056.1 Methyltransferases isoform 1 [Tripterygium wilfordii]
METRCSFWLPKKNRFCATAPLHGSTFCGNHSPRSQSQWIPCPIDPSHSVLEENLEGHVKRCPFLKNVQSLALQPYYHKGINAGSEEVGQQRNTLSLDKDITSEMKRSAVYSMSIPEFQDLLRKIRNIHSSICKDIRDSYKIPEACGIWIKREVDRKLPFQEKHVMQQASILGNLEDIGVLKTSFESEQLDNEDPYRDDDGVLPAVIEFGAGRGYLTQMLADGYGIKKVFLVERKSYKLKADRSLRQKESLILERLRIDIEDLNLSAVESLHGVPYLAIGKHLCGPATDLTLRCCLGEQSSEDNLGQSIGHHYPIGLAIATCCHHLCQWKHYINKKYLCNLGIKKEEFHAITWFTSWAVDADHSSDITDVTNGRRLHFDSIGKEECGEDVNTVEEIVRNMKAVERAVLGFMCKQIIDIGRSMWIMERGFKTRLVKYVPSSISPENHLLVSRCVQQ